MERKPYKVMYIKARDYFYCGHERGGECLGKMESFYRDLQMGTIYMSGYITSGCSECEKDIIKSIKSEIAKCENDKALQNCKLLWKNEKQYTICIS